MKLINQFGPKGFTAFVQPRASFHCNPVMKTIKTPSGTQVFKVTNPNAHLVCLQINGTDPAQVGHLVYLQNQFGSGEVSTYAPPNVLCVPSWTGLTAPPNKTVDTPPGLNHFACYGVVAGSRPFPGFHPYGVSLRDAFATTNIAVTVQKTAYFLCVSTTKVVGSKVYPRINPAVQLMCFGSSPTPHKTSLWDQNQFGTAKMTIAKTFMLCVPTKMTIRS